MCSTHARDLIDAFLQKMEVKTGKDSTFTGRPSLFKLNKYLMKVYDRRNVAITTTDLLQRLATLNLGSYVLFRHFCKYYIIGVISYCN